MSWHLTVMVTKKSIIKQLIERGLKLTPQGLAVIEVFVTEMHKD